MNPDRRTVLADAAVAVLAEGGMRALTHRAVDGAAGLPAGTTSAYLRTRNALLTAVVRRIVELDQAELEAAGATAATPRDPGELTSAIAAFTRQRLGPGRQRSLARYACAVESVHHPELREILAPRRNAARDVVQDFLVAHGVPPEEAGRRTITLLACVDGLVFDRLVNSDQEGGLDREVGDLLAVALGRTAAGGS
ncbi:TetR/AcrR family transcriptional regulator [Streptomyces sp. NPDC002867]